MSDHATLNTKGLSQQATDQAKDTGESHSNPTAGLPMKVSEPEGCTLGKVEDS